MYQALHIVHNRIKKYLRRSIHSGLSGTWTKRSVRREKNSLYNGFYTLSVLCEVAEDGTRYLVTPPTDEGLIDGQEVLCRAQSSEVSQWQEPLWYSETLMECQTV